MQKHITSISIVVGILLMVILVSNVSLVVIKRLVALDSQTQAVLLAGAALAWAVIYGAKLIASQLAYIAEILDEATGYTKRKNEALKAALKNMKERRWKTVGTDSEETIKAA